MARKIPQTSLKQISEINLTPLMDLTFILLITFIITFPLIEQGIPVNLPQGKAREVVDDKARTVTLDVKGQLYLDNEPVSVEDLQTVLTALGQSSPDVAVMLRADKTIPYGKVVDVLKILNRANIRKMALVTQDDS